MLGSLPTRSREADQLRVELADELFAAIKSADDTLRYAAPEDSVSDWNGEAA